MSGVIRKVLTTFPKRNVIKKLILLIGLAVVFLCFDLFILISKNKAAFNGEDVEVNNWGENEGLILKKNRQREVPQSELKTILMWNDAYGVREYDIGHGREPFYEFKCPETRCYATANRSYLADVTKFDALLIHQRGIQWNDMPKKRAPHQRYVHWNMESAQYLYMDINKLNGLFNWTMTYKKSSDFYLPYAYVHKIKEHPEGQELKRFIKEFGKKNRHLVNGRKEGEKPKAAWFVSHCATVARREKYVKVLQRYMDVDIYGECGDFQCSRHNETACYLSMEKNYKFYLSFENSICDDYVTEKYFNILKYDVIPVVYGGADYEAVGPPGAAINALKFESPAHLAKHLKRIDEDDSMFAGHFWWRDFYEVRTGREHRAQPYCDLCRRLNDPDEPPKVVEDMFKWWVSESHCKRLKLG